ncbi:MAG: hypothetical protein COB73_02195 [Flavobacteriaceae bacterium]|nr:MAG: hypothetical protein COB73_02195 [Flavobacteriaceae bacterium]
MSVLLKLQNKKISATFTGDIAENEIRDTFIEITETYSIKNISCILFYFKDITSYTPPKNALQKHKTISHFTASWNRNIKAVIVATHPDIAIIAKGFVKNQANLNWNYYYFDNLEDALIFCK